MYIALDAMGGDYAPEETVKGAVAAVNEKKDFNVYLVGDQSRLEDLLSQESFDQGRIEIVPASQEITMHDAPATAIRQKPDSSLARAFDLVAEGRAGAILSAGNTGAILSGAIFKLKRIKGVSRPALAPFFPCLREGKNRTLVLDVGANADCKPEYLAQFAFMASEYMRILYGQEHPSVGLINIGTEESKGNELTKAAYELLGKTPVQFIGNVESREIMTTEADILVTDGFTGNIVLKFMEGMAKAMMGEIKKTLTASTKAKMGAALIKNDLKQMKSNFDSEAIGAAILLGVNGGVFKAHGNSCRGAIKNGLLQAKDFVDGNVIQIIKENMIDIGGNVDV